MLKVIEMSDEQINNCLVFLNRSNLNGAEAEALVMIKMALKNSKVKDEYMKLETSAKGQANSGAGSSHK